MTRRSSAPVRHATWAGDLAALAADPDRARWNDSSVTAADLAREYGFTDIDGSRPDARSAM